MDEARGGTQMFCPHCASITVCAAVSTTSVGFPSGQRWHRTDHADVQWFRRGRECQNCKRTFLTAEVQEQFLEELVELRNALADIKVNAESYVSQSSAAAQSLAKLTSSLSVLRALKVYSAGTNAKGEADF